MLPRRPVERIVGLGFEDVVAGPARLEELARRLDEVHATGVSLGVGRVDWAAFPWAAGRHTWSDVVQRRGHDHVAEAIGALGHHGVDGRDRRRSVVLVLDTLVGGWIARDPGVAGVDAAGVRSDVFPSLAQLESGAVGERIVELARTLATRYRPSAISLTELVNATHTFGADDLASYRRFSAAHDWPRTPDGEIEQGHPTIARWRSVVIARLVARVRAATAASGVPLWMEVRVRWDRPLEGRPDSGHDRRLLLRAADRLVLWGYPATVGRPGTDLLGLARAWRSGTGGRTLMSVGLWGTGEQPMAPADLLAASQASVQGGMRSVWVTPTSLMTAAHWDALTQGWARTRRSSSDE